MKNRKKTWDVLGVFVCENCLSVSICISGKAPILWWIGLPFCA